MLPLNYSGAQKLECIPLSFLMTPAQSLAMDNSTILSQLATFFNVTPKNGFIRQVTYERLQNITTLNPALLNNSLIFYRDPLTGLLQNNVSGSSGPAIVTLPACKAISGPGIFGLYPDATARLLTWLVPVILLVTNLQYAPLGLSRFAMIPHLFGDPIDSAWSLLSKVETRNRCLAMAKELCRYDVDQERTQNVGLIITAIEELSSQVKKTRCHDTEAGQEANEYPEIESGESSFRNTGIEKGASISTKMIRLPRTGSNLYTAIQSHDISHFLGFTIEKTPFCTCPHPKLDRLYQTTARSILENHTHGTGQTIFAIGVYIVLGILAAFIPAFGGNSSPSGNKIATSILLSWLLPNILLSNIVGNWTSPRACFDIVTCFKERLEELDRDRERVHKEGCKGLRARKWIREMDGYGWKVYSNTLVETGSIYSFRLSKRFPGHKPSPSSLPSRPYIVNADMTNTAIRVHNHWKLTILSILPVCTSFFAAFTVLWSPPTYFSCRHVMIISMFASWPLSALFTSSISRLCLSLKFSFNIILVKDIILSSTILSLLVLSASGLFNSCWCWTGWWYLSRFSKDTEPQVQLNPDGPFTENNKWIYPVIVGLTLGAQLLWFLCMLWIGRDVYFRLMRRK